MENSNKSKKCSRFVNFILQDGVLKEQVRIEEATRLRWNERWGFLKHFTGAQEKVDVAREKSISSELHNRISMTTKKKGSKPTAVSTRDLPHSGPVPLTTTGEIGWRSSKRECNLEIMGPFYISPKHTMEPPDSDPITNYNYIFLG